MWLTFGLVFLIEDGSREYRKLFVLFGRRKSSSLFPIYEKLKVIGETRSSNQAPLQSKVRDRMCKGPQQTGWGG